MCRRLLLRLRGSPRGLGTARVRLDVSSHSGRIQDVSIGPKCSFCGAYVAGLWMGIVSGLRRTCAPGWDSLYCCICATMATQGLPSLGNDPKEVILLAYLGTESRGCGKT